MSDHTPVSRHHHKNVRVLGISRKKKYLKVFGILLLAGLAAITYFTITSGILADENTAIPPYLINRINTERAAHDLPPLTVSDTLSRQAVLTGRVIRVTPASYTSWATAPADPGSDVFIYSRLSGALSDAGLEPMLFDRWIASDTGFASHILDKDAREVGIGMSSDGYNYYIAAKWR